MVSIEKLPTILQILKELTFMQTISNQSFFLKKQTKYLTRRTYRILEGP